MVRGDPSLVAVGDWEPVPKGATVVSVVEHPVVDTEPSRDEAADTRGEGAAVLRIIWADPQHTAEHLALWTLRRFGPRAESAVATVQARHPAAGREELEQLVVEREARVAATEGAFVGGPFIVLIPVAFCTALLAQGQMVFELAAVAGLDPTDELRAAELLVVLGAYPSTDEAAAALAEVPRQTGSRKGPRLPAGRRVDAVKRLAYLVELLGPPDQKRSTFREAVGWIGIGLLFLIGLVLPLVWVPYMAFSMHRTTRRVAVRARTFYSTGGAEETLVVAPGDGLVAGGSVIAFARIAILVVFPIVLGLVGLLAGLSLAGDHWLAAGAILLAASALGTFGWLGYRRWRRGKRSSA